MANVRSTAYAVSLFTSTGVVAIATMASSARADQPFLLPNSLVISSSTYDNKQGAVASLIVNQTALAGTKTATTLAVADKSYVNVWKNESADASFGVTSPIYLTDIEPHSGHVFHVMEVPTDQVVTSFPSKSELGLHIAQSGHNAQLTFVAYAGAPVGALDVSNSDAEANQDPTNPVTFAFGPNYAFHRTIVSVDSAGNLTYTPTIDYGGNNGRSALLGSNGLYYAVGNANNGDATAFGPPGPNNDTVPDVTETTGLEVVHPINGKNAFVAIPANNSAEVYPLLQYCKDKTPNPLISPCPVAKNADKPGKDDNFRGVTEFGGALYFTKGSGSNGVDTVYTVTTLPTLATAASTPIGVVPGFPTDTARITGGDFTPFAVFFANPTTMYVTDEGTGDAADTGLHAGLEKWSLVKGVWQLDYVLTQGLIGTVDGELLGSDGQYPDVTTIGLRNLTGLVNSDGTVTLWATTSTSSASTDNGADPNKVVAITDQLAATTMTGAVAQETFTSVVGPTYGTVYRGVAYVCPSGGLGAQGICSAGQ